MIEQFGDMLTVWDEMLENTSLLDSQYELVGENSRWPQNYDEVSSSSTKKTPSTTTPSSRSVSKTPPNSSTP